MPSLVARMNRQCNVLYAKLCPYFMIVRTCMDRLTTLFRHVTFEVLTTPERNRPYLQVVPQPSGVQVSFSQRRADEVISHCAIGLSFGSQDNPVLSALPSELHIVFTAQDAAYPVAQMILDESHQGRCGSPAVLARLYEVLLILLLRRAIEIGQETPGLLAGLADSHLKYALVAVHDQPGADWSTERLAELCHLSRTAFYQRFNRCIGQSPMQYVRRWRMALAKTRLANGERVGPVAKQLGYRSQEGFSRAFYQHFGFWPAHLGDIKTQ